MFFKKLQLNAYLGPDPRQDPRFSKTNTAKNNNKIQKGKYLAPEPYTKPPKIPSKPKKPLISLEIFYGFLHFSL